MCSIIQNVTNTNVLFLDSDFVAENGKKYTSLTVGYNTFGKLNNDGTNVIWIFHGLTANSNPQDWWPGMVGENMIFDSKKYFIVCVNMLGSCYGTGYVEKDHFSPTDPAIPRFTIRDQVSFFTLVAEKFKIKSIELLVGASIGGFIAQEWAISQPDYIKKLALIATSYYVSPWAAAFNEAQRMALLADMSFETNLPNAGNAGLAAARAVAMLSYRGHKAFCATQGGRHQVEPYLHKSTTYQRYQGKKLVQRFKPKAYLDIINTFDSFNIKKGRKSFKDALSLISAKTLVIAFSSDLLFPVEEQIQLAVWILNSQIEIIEADFGHDSFLLEGEQIQKHLKNRLGI